jgi:hypothetical protein
VSITANAAQTPSIGNDTIYDWEAGDLIVLLNQSSSQVAHAMMATIRWSASME